MMVVVGFFKNTLWRHLIVSLILLFCYNSVNAQVTADFTTDAHLCGSAHVNFAVTSPTPTSNYKYKWTFIVGKPTQNTPNASFDFPIPLGSATTTYQVKLNVYNLSGTPIDSITKPVDIEPKPIPVLQDVNLRTPFSNCGKPPTIQNPTYPLTVNNLSRDPGSIASYIINWGDGTGNFSFPGSTTQFNYTYTKLGLFRLKFTAYGVNGCAADTTYIIKNQGNPAIGIGSKGNTSGCAPVYFGFSITNFKYNDRETTYTVDFGDGTIIPWSLDSIKNNDTTVYHTYLKSSCSQTNGMYTVKITATNACQSTSVFADGVRVGQKPVPRFTVSNLCEGEPVVFQNTSDPGSNFDCSKNVLYRWNFGDGKDTLTTANGGMVTHVFPTTSTVYNVQLIAINDCQDSARWSHQINLLRRPVAHATVSTTSGCIPLNVNVLTNTSVGDSTTTIWSVSPSTGWNYVVPTNSSSLKPQFRFTTKGNYYIKLTVRNNCTSNDTTFHIFANGAINVTFPNIGNQCNTYTFDATNTSVFRVDTIPNESVHADWLVTPNSGYTYISGTNAQSLHPKIRFDSVGNYTLRVILNNGCDIDTITKSFKFANTPVAAATPSKTELCIPDVVHFTNQSTGFEVVPTWPTTLPAGASYTNGTTANSPSPDIRFTQAGIYTIRLTATNACNSDTKSFSIKAKDTATVTLKHINNICENGSLTINSSLLTVAANNGGTPIYAWTVSPNSGFTYQNSTNSTSPFPQYQFTTSGSYTISVTVTNECGSVTRSQPFDVRPNGLLITAISDSSGCAPKVVTFTDSSTGDNLTHKWSYTPTTGVSFVSGTSSTSASPSLQFTQAGTYYVTHTLSGLCSVQSKTFKIEVSTIPTINLLPIANSCALPYTLNIDSTKFSINQNGKAFSNIRWWVTDSTNVTFIDGTNRNNKYPHFLFSQTGRYTVWVETSNDCGKVTASQIFWVLAHATEKTSATPLTGCLPYKVNFTDQSTGDLLVHKWSVSPASGWSMTSPTSSASNEISFNTPGIYTVTHSVTNQCGTNAHNYTVKVKDAPSVTLGLKTNSCNNYTYVANSLNMKLISNYNDSITYLWTISPFSAITYLSGTSDTSHYPIIQFADTGVFYVKVRTMGECSFLEAHQIINITKGPEIRLKDSLSSQCLPSNLYFSGIVWGQNLKYSWTVTPSAGATFVNGTTATSPLPQINFNRPGNYSVTLNVSNDCSTDIKKWDYTIFDKPTIVFNKVADTCDNFTFRAEKYVVVLDNGNSIGSYNWTVAPSTGFSYIDGTTATSPLPHIAFTTANAYTVTMNATNGCGTTSISRSFTIDQFIQVEAGADTTLCTFNTLFALKGIPAGGSWSISPSSASAVLKLIGSSYYLDLNVPGSYTLTYTRGNSYCSSQDIRHFTILPLPVVDAGKDFTLCENDKNLYSLSGIPAGGTWSGSGVSGNTFSTNGLTAGSYILKYTLTDPTTNCTNTDQLVARLLPVPITGFTMVAQGCKDAPILFTPNGTAGTVYNWDFGDTQSAISSGTINHTYRTGGVFTVKMISADPNSCSITTTKKIVILDDITLPVVTITPNRGCGPLTVSITADTTGTTGNGQRYSWNFGNGQVVSVPFTRKDITYYQGINDTTYNITLTLSNNCFTKTVVYPVMVNALPHANFALPHSWECSPKIVSIKNLSQDRAASFLWYFGDGTTSTEYEPTHTFTTGKTATTYMIKLVAQNNCGKDSITRPLLIKPNSIEVFIQMDKRTACPGELVTFTNFSSDTVQQITTYYWDFGDGVISNTWNATHAYANQGRYTIKLFVDNGCSYAEKTDTILIYPPLTLTITSRDSVCVGENIYFEGKSPLGTLINSKWDFGDGYFGANAATNHTFLTPGWINVTFTAATAANLSHCTGSIVKRIYVKALPTAAPANDIEGCSPVVLNLLPAGNDPQLWNFGEDSTWTSLGKHTYHNDSPDNKPLRRKVSMVTENTMGCRSYSSFWVTIYPVPKAKIRAYSAGGSPENVFLTSLSTNTTACEWLFPDGSTAQGCDSVLVKFYNNGFYKIQLRSSNQYGCADTTSIMYETIIKGLFVPNAFKPSDANSEVNTFKPVGIGLKTYYMGIFDTWDNLIWETRELLEGKPTVGWDGNSVKGKNLPMDVYIWRVKATFIDGTEWKGMKGKDGKLRTEGTVTLIK